MNTRQVDCFLAVGKTLSFSSAASELFLSQSTVSQHIMALEKELDFPLFERNRRKVVLTDAGEFLFSQLLDLRFRYDAAIDRARSIAKGGASGFRLGYDGPLAEPWIATTVELFHRSMPDVPLQLRKEPMVRLAGLLQAGALDAALIGDTELRIIEGVRFHPVLEGNACVFFPKGHRFEKMKCVTPEDLRSEKLITSYELPNAQGPSMTGIRLYEAGVDLSRAELIPDGDTAFMAVKAGVGVFVASHLCDRFAARFDLQSVDLQTDLGPARLVLAWTNENPSIPMLIRCIERAVGT